uniref:FCL1 n=1 Tax=Takifugu rubripes TaxID=31033 RepID=Q8AV25_TAKRU|nr:fCL1 [Takifugu rubripes]
MFHCQVPPYFLNPIFVFHSNCHPQGAASISRKIIPINVLRKVSRWTIQSSVGACDIDAVILHVRDKRICVDQTVFKDIWWRMKQWKQRVKKRAAKYNV